ncbi:MAG: cephalosporin hydroxylase family protein [Fibrobacteres bacterium]|nr:cephalosporin hydroxylase family protein [Fibrobacterota bacterium]
MNEIEKFKAEVEENIKGLGNDPKNKQISLDWLLQVSKHKYVYNFTWMGRPIIQAPQDIVAMQEIIWDVQPDLIIETGIAHGGSIILYASILELIGKGEVLGIDLDIRSHNFKEIINHPMYKRITMLEGSSIDSKIAEKVRAFAAGKKKILVSLDSNHTHEHVLKELEIYAPLVTVGSYCVVFDTLVDEIPDEYYTDRPWKKGDNPKSAVREYLKSHPEYVIDKRIDHKIQISAAPDGYLKRIK